MNRRTFFARALASLASMLTLWLFPKPLVSAETSPFQTSLVDLSATEKEAMALLTAGPALQPGDVIVVRSGLSPAELQVSPLGHAICDYRERCKLPGLTVMVMPAEAQLGVLRLANVEAVKQVYSKDLLAREADLQGAPPVAR